MADGPMPRGLLGVGIGDVVRCGDAWTLYLGGYSTTFRNRLYRATATGDDPVALEWTVHTDRRSRARALLPDAPRNAWDGGGMHTPSYLAAADGHPARIYYAGREGRRHTGEGSRYAVGMLERRDGAWRRAGPPLLRGDGARPSALEPRVVRHDGLHTMWYLAAPHEVAPGEQPDYELRTTTSRDGVTGWSTPRVFATAAEGFFDVALLPGGAGWTLVLARGTNLHGTAPFPEQGLWRMTAPSPSAHRADWSAPERILDTEAPGTPAWMGAGVCDPALAARPDGSLVVFVTGTRRNRGWVRLAAERLRQGRRLPVPAPFHLAAGLVIPRP